MPTSNVLVEARYMCTVEPDQIWEADHMQVAPCVALTLAPTACAPCELQKIHRPRPAEKSNGHMLRGSWIRNTDTLDKIASSTNAHVQKGTADARWQKHGRPELEKPKALKARPENCCAMVKSRARIQFSAASVSLRHSVVEVRYKGNGKYVRLPV